MSTLPVILISISMLIFMTPALANVYYQWKLRFKGINKVTVRWHFTYGLFIYIPLGIIFLIVGFVVLMI